MAAPRRGPILCGGRHDETSSLHRRAVHARRFDLAGGRGPDDPFRAAGRAGGDGGHHAAPIAEAWSALDAAWDAAPLAFATATFVDGDVAGYGRYTPLGEARFAPGETMVVYAEPVGFGFSKVADGLKVDLVADFEVLNASGQVLASQTGFADLGVTARKRLHEFHTTLRFAFEGLRARRLHARHFPARPHQRQERVLHPSLCRGRVLRELNPQQGRASRTPAGRGTDGLRGSGGRANMNISGTNAVRRIRAGRSRKDIA